MVHEVQLASNTPLLAVSRVEGCAHFTHLFHIILVDGSALHHECDLL